MLYFRQSVILINIFFVIVQSKKYYYYPRSIEGSTTSPFTTNSLKYSPELIQDLRDFIDLIPKIKVDAVIAEHMIVDYGFRKAITFLRSSHFKQLQQQAEQMPEIINIINYVHLNDTSTIETSNRVRRNTRDYPEINRDIVIVVLMPSVHQSNWRSFISFVEEILSFLPRQDYVNLIKEKSQKSPIFAEFYKAIRSPEFNTMIEQAMATQNVKSLISTLSSNYIDAHSLKNIALQVISWGPNI